MRRLRAIPLTVLALIALTITVSSSPGERGRSRSEEPNVASGLWPTPQRAVVQPHGFALGRVVGIVRDDATDPAALEVVTDALMSSGVTDIRTVAADPHTPVTIWLGETGPALRRLRVAGAAGLPAEGYVLVSRRLGAGGQVVIDGTDPAGQYYAAQTLRNLIGAGTRKRATAATPSIPEATIRDWPSMRYRGSVEGFYGTPWTHAERLDHLDYLGAHKMNSYAYSPKDDPYLRQRWRDPYPPERLAEFGELVERAHRNHLEFTFALSPGLSICFSSPDDVAAVLGKFEAIYELGGRSFNLPFDDIDEDTRHCPGDGDRFGSGPAGAGAAQAQLLNHVHDWAVGKGDVRRVQMVPTEYYDTSESPYKRVLRDELNRDVIVLWTGVGVIPATITAAQAAAAKAAFGHDILLWDNYPVNDYIPGRLPLAPYTGRQTGLSRELVGVLANPANQAAVSKVSLFSVADLAWRDATHDPVAAWSAALSELAGGDAATMAALVVFADLSTMDTKLHLTQAPKTGAAIAAFWLRWHEGDRSGAVAAMRAHADAVADGPERIRAGVNDRAFVDQAEAWLQATALWGEAMQAALDMLAAEAAGDETAALAAHARTDELVTRLADIRGSRDPHTTVGPLVGDGVVDTFVRDAGAELAKWRAATGRTPTK